MTEEKKIPVIEVEPVEETFWRKSAKIVNRDPNQDKWRHIAAGSLIAFGLIYVLATFYGNIVWGIALILVACVLAYKFNVLQLLNQ